MQAIKIDLTDKIPNLKDSKIGGPFIHPKEPMGPLLAQIKLSDLPENTLFPKDGYLQFFASDGSACEVCYLKKLTGNIHGFRRAKTPVLKQCKLEFSPAEEEMSPYDFRFIETEEWEKMSEDERDKVFNKAWGSKLLGYPAFTQEDPRRYHKDLQRYDTLLFQLDSSRDKVMWGDMGVGNFFISKEDLAKQDFHDVLFHWDCY